MLAELNLVRDWAGFFVECIICVYVVWEFYYDAAIEEKKQKRTRTTKKTTTQPSGVSTVEETSEVIEPPTEKSK